MWEIERHNWSSLRACGNASSLPAAISKLISARDDASADAAYWLIDNRVVVQGAVYESALPTMACLTRSLIRAEPVARTRILELLVQICGGEAAPDEQTSGNPSIVEECLQELVWCSSLLFELLEVGMEEEREWCVDLLGLIARFEHRLVRPVIDYLSKHASRDDVRPELAKNWIRELSSIAEGVTR